MGLAARLMMTGPARHVDSVLPWRTIPKGNSKPVPSPVRGYARGQPSARLHRRDSPLAGGPALQSQRPVPGRGGRRSGSGRQRSLTNPTWSPGFGFTWEFAAGAYPENSPKRPIKGLTRIRTKGAAIATAASTARQSTAKMMLFLQNMAPPPSDLPMRGFNPRPLSSR